MAYSTPGPKERHAAQRVPMIRGIITIVIHVFIDTNVYLDFYSFSSDDLEELRKLQVAISNNEITLWATSQVEDEIARNREGQIVKSLNALQDMHPSSQGAPHVARNLRTFPKVLTARRDYGEKLNAIEAEVRDGYENETLAADQVLKELIDSAHTIVATSVHVDAARHRAEVGNPPGKRGSLGDAINWECLLSEVPDAVDLYFLSSDKDFRSQVNPESLKEFLINEWREAKSADVILHQRLSSFFADKYPDIKLASELERELRVRALVESNSFDETHRALLRLDGETDFTDSQIDDLLEAARLNNQIHWISGDRDVHQFFQRLIDAYGDRLDERELRRINELFNPGAPQESTSAEEPPF